MSIDNQKTPETCFILLPEIKSARNTARDLETLLAEAEGLAEAINLKILKSLPLNVTKIQSGHFFSRGNLDKVAQEFASEKPDVIIVNHTLSPVQQRNLEKEWNTKVIDRTGLILEIFGERAKTKEGRLQVDLAALEYQKSRLVRSWTHLERQRGGAGFMGGPGERQIELDRRIINDKIVRLKAELNRVKRTRDLGAKSRERMEIPIIALIGYTNAGKSTLFNCLTQENVFAKDLLFATLDPKMRRIELPSGEPAILSDTVGFISDLPTQLIAAFRATLEQVNHADIIVHVMDASSHDMEEQKKDVINVLSELGVEYEEDSRIIEAYNKTDVLDQDEKNDLLRRISSKTNTVHISALKGEGADILLHKIQERLSLDEMKLTYDIDAADGAALAWLHAHSKVIDANEGQESIKMTVSIKISEANKFTKKFPYHSKPAIV